MARTISEIQAGMLATYAERVTELDIANAPSSPSATSLTRLIFYVAAVCFWVNETLWDKFRGEVAETIRRQPIATCEWYAEQALAFQMGDEVVVLDSGVVGYAVPVPVGDVKRVVARAAVRETPVGKVMIKVARAGATAGTLQPLNGPQLMALAKYFDRVRFAGTPLQLGSFEADRLRVYGTVYYDAAMPISDAKFRATVRAAIRVYLADLPFDGRVQLSRLVDAVQAVPYVLDFVVDKWEARAGQQVSPPLGRDYDTGAGYVLAEDGAGLTGIVPDLEETLDYKAGATASGSRTGI